MTSVLLTGGTGQIGRACQAQDWPEGWTIVAPGRNELDLSLTESIAACLQRVGPDLIINAGAYTAVDKAESEPELVRAVNAGGPAAIASYCRQAGIPLIQLSTDYVFGNGQGYRREGDEASPLGVYGSTKLAGEQAVLTVADRVLVLRTAWVVSPWGHNFLRTMLRLARDRDELRVVADQRGCPTSAADVADAIRMIAIRLVQDQDAPTGVVHFVNAGEASWAGMADEIMKAAAAIGLPSAAISAIRSDEYPTPVRRPADSRLDTQRIREWFGIVPRPWQQAIRQVVEQFAADEGSGS